MHSRRALLWACVLAAGTTNALADDFLWTGGAGDWEDPGNWIGPVNQYPDSVLDVATITGSGNLYVNSNLSLAELNLIGSADILPGPYSIFVNGDITLNHDGARFVVPVSPSLRDVDADIVDLLNGMLVVGGGLLQVDEELRLHGGSEINGVGTIEMNSTTGDLVFDGGGLLWAWGSQSQGYELLLTRTGNSTSRLDWTHPDTSIVASFGASLINELPYTGALGGSMSLYSSDFATRFESTHAVLAGASSVISMNGSNGNQTRFIAPVFDTYGDLSVIGETRIESPFTALRGTLTMHPDTDLIIDATSLIFDSLDVEATGGPVWIGTPTSGTLTVRGGTTHMHLGSEGSIDLDGSGSRDVHIEEGATFSIQARSIETGPSSIFNATLEIEGTLDMEILGESNLWENAGEILLDGGEVEGDRLVNTGEIRGTGHVDAYTVNNGEIIADGGTLSFRSIDIDGDESPAVGVVRAETGDLVMNMQSNGGFLHFRGDAYVGDGVGIREVLQMNVELLVSESQGATGSLHLNSGFVVLHDLSQNGELFVEGESMIRTTGNETPDRIAFTASGVNTIVGTLEVDGETWVVPGAQFVGEGDIEAVSTVKRTFFQDGSDLGDVGFSTVGEVSVLSNFDDGVATMGSLALANTADLHVRFNDTTDVLTADRIIAHDQAALGGTLTLLWESADPAPVGETVTIIEAGSIVGSFDTIDDSGLGSNRRAFVTVGQDSVEVFITCAADLNADGVADIFDVTMFLSLFEAMDPAADLNDNGQHDLFDVLVYLNMFDEGC